MKKRFKAPRQSAEMSLNITAMADIFTVLLVFLLMGISSGGASVSPSAGITLPGAVAESANVEALKIEISRNSIQVESKPVLTLTDYHFAKSDLNPDGTSIALTDAVKVLRQRQLALAKVNADVKLDPRMILIADEKVPYSTVKAVLASVAVQGYTDFKLAVFNKSN